MNPYANMLSFVVDPQRDGVDNALWLPVTGSLAVASSKFRFNASEGLVRADLFQGRYEFPVTFPLTQQIEAAVYAGAEGLDDATSGGTYDGGAVVATYVVTIDAEGTPDTFAWTKDGAGGAVGVAITGAAQTLSDGVTITFNATTGHTATDSWTIVVSLETPADLVNDIEFGLKNLSLGTKGKIAVFADKSEGTFQFLTYDDQGNAQTTTITWNTAWDSVETRFRIEWFNDRIGLEVLTSGSTIWQILASHKTRVGVYALNPYVKVTGAENFDVAYIAVEKAKGSSIMLI